jgi:putative membrane protein
MPLSTSYLWLKALHIAFMVTWFAGLFYLPRLFIYHSEATDDTGRSRFTVLTALFGLALLNINRALLYQGWFQVKLVLLVGMVVYHLRCHHWIRRLAAGNFPNNTKWLRWFNELPTIFLLLIVCLAVVKNF